MFKLTGSKQVAEFATGLADEFIRLCPAGAKKAQPYVARVVDELARKLAEFHKTEQLGMIGKARFGTEFKHRLLDNGYDTPLVDDLTAKLLRVLTGQ